MTRSKDGSFVNNIWPTPVGPTILNEPVPPDPGGPAGPVDPVHPSNPCGPS